MRIPYWTFVLCTALCLTSCQDDTPPVATEHTSTVETAGATQGEVTASQVTSENPVSIDSIEKAPLGTPNISKPTAHPLLMATAKYLPIEQQFIQQNSLSVENSAPALKSQHFDQIVNAFQRETLIDQDAQELSRLYQSEAAKALPNGGRLVSLVCGLSACFGSVRAPSESSLTQWSAKFSQSKRAPTFSQLDYMMQIAPNEYEDRFIFSTDPAANSLSGHIPPSR